MAKKTDTTKTADKGKSKAKGKSGKREEIAISGTKTSGTTVGSAREIKAPDLPDAKLIDSSQIGPIERIDPYKLGDADLADKVDIDKTDQAQFRDFQLGLAKQLEAQTRGEGPSLANLQLQEATQKNIAEQLGLAFSAQGPNGALGQRTAAYNAGNLNQTAALQSAQLRMAEQLQAQQALGTLTGQARGQDLTLAQAQADLDLQRALANAAAKNQFQLAQGELSQNASIANQSAANTAATNQAQLNQQANIANQGATNTAAQQQAALAQQAAIANQSSFNSVQQAQADINARLAQSRMSAAASTAAANAAASASRYGTDAGLYKFNADLAFEMDKYYQGQSRTDINDIYDTNAAGAKNDYAVTNDEMNSVGNFGGALAKQNAMSSTQKLPAKL